MFFPVKHFNRRGDGRFVGISDSAIGGVAGRNVFWADMPGTAWNTVTLTGALANSAISWGDIDFGGPGTNVDDMVYMMTSTSYSGGLQMSKGAVSPSGEQGDWTEITLPTQPFEVASWPRPRWIPYEQNRWVLTCANNEWRIPQSVDNGQNWTNTSRLDTGADAMICSGIDYAEGFGNWVACGANPFSAGLRFSDDNLATMQYATRVGGGALPAVVYHDIRYDPVTGFVVVGWAGGWGWSEDGGESYDFITTDTGGQPLNIFRIIHTPAGLIAVSDQTGVTSGRDFYYSTTGDTVTRVDMNPTSSGVYSRIAYNGRVVGACGYLNDVNFKNFATFVPPPVNGSSFTEQVNVVPSTNVHGLAARWAWWL